MNHLFETYKEASSELPVMEGVTEWLIVDYLSSYKLDDFDFVSEKGDDGKYEIVEAALSKILERRGDGYVTFEEIISASKIPANKEKLRNAFETIVGKKGEDGYWWQYPWYEGLFGEGPGSRFTQVQAVLDDDDASQEEIDEQLDMLLLDAFKAAKSEEALLAVVSLLEHKGWGALEATQKELGEAIRYIKWRKMYSSNYSSDDPPNLVEVHISDINEFHSIIQGAVGDYKTFFQHLNGNYENDPLMAVKNALNSFIDNAKYAYKDWAKAIEAEKEIAWLCEEWTEHNYGSYKLLDGVAQKVYSCKPTGGYQTFGEVFAVVKNITP